MKGKPLNHGVTLVPTVDVDVDVERRTKSTGNGKLAMDGKEIESKISFGSCFLEIKRE